MGTRQDRTYVGINKAILRLLSTTGGVVSSQIFHVQIVTVPSDISQTGFKSQQGLTHLLGRNGTKVIKGQNPGD